MRIKEIYIHNYRQYRDLKFIFPDKVGEYDLHVIHGQNGMGKTNVLNAINWCLYGDEPHLSDKHKSLPIINNTVVEEGLNEGKKFDTVIVKITTEDNGSKVIFETSADVKLDNLYRYESKTIVTTIDVNGKVDFIENEEDVKEMVNHFTPENIRQFFYFDGEQLQRYFTTNSSKNIKDTVHAISQVDLVTSVKTKLSSIITEKNNTLSNRNPELKLKQTDKERLEQNIIDDKNTISEYSDQIKKFEDRITELEDLLRGKEGIPELENKRSLLSSEIDKLEQQHQTLINDMIRFVKKYRILISFYNSASTVLAIIKEKENKNELPPTIDRVLLEDMLKEHECKVCGHKLSEDEENKISMLLEQIQISSSTSNTLKEIKNELIYVIKETKEYSKIKKELFDKKEKIKKEYDLKNKEFSEINQKIESISDNDKVLEWNSDRNKYKEHIKNISEKKGRLLAQYELDKKDLSKLDDEIAKIQEKMMVEKRTVQLVNFATESRSIVTEIETEMMDDIRSQIESETTKYFHNLIWKKNTYGNVVLNEDYEIDLLHKNGLSCFGSSSAGEHMLLTLAFSLAVHKVSHFDAMLFIDTPVANISDVNRTNFANVLKEVSKTKQIILTLTPSEYSEEIKEVFDPIIASSVLETVDEEQTKLYGGN